MGGRYRRPFRLNNTVTAGIVSAKSRNLPDEQFVPFIQTDVAVNPGNSGGPLFNMKEKSSVSTPKSSPLPAVSWACPLPSRLIWLFRSKTS